MFEEMNKRPHCIAEHIKVIFILCIMKEPNLSLWMLFPVK